MLFWLGLGYILGLGSGPIYTMGKKLFTIAKNKVQKKWGNLNDQVNKMS